MSRLPLLSLFVLMACQPTLPPAPAPVVARTSRAPRQALEVALRELKSQGFEIVSSDDVRGVLSARVTRRPVDFGTQLTCAKIRGLDVENLAQATMTIDLEIRPNGAGSELSLSSRTRTRVGETGTPQAIDDEKTCASTGVVEASVVKAIRA